MTTTAIFPDLKNKIILVTGASRGIGKTICESLCAQGATVVFSTRGTSEEKENLRQHFESFGGKSYGLSFDVTDTAKAQEQLEQFTKEVGPISGLVNNAGVARDQLIMRVKSNDVDDILNVNLKSAIMMCSLLSRNFLKAKEVSIVNISSVVGLMGNAAQTVYAASKAGLLGLTKSLAKELSSRQVRCNAICPGFIETDMTVALDEKVKLSYLTGIPLGKFGKTQDVANLTCFLLSMSSSYITGEVIKVDGGLYI
ncbi:MAG: beta-ketoacyl-ACP reductase [Bdellovibrionales bacterium GWA2_49_15]|nr:MAG: beta-ketoacyl-ACP reductase [Bdellovibrionales bacterium GWA2_49_15]HAZ12095.1 beta-ketoacyl-ACP reductase [Bdellovibrionales bacterium]